MESSSMLLLLEKILSGRPGDPHKHSECYSKLHETLTSTSQANLRAALVTIKQMHKQSQISSETLAKFSEYLKNISEGKNAIPPNLSYLTFSSNPACKKAAKIFHAVNKIQSKRASVLKNALEKLKNHRDNANKIELISSHNLEIKRLKCLNLISNLKIGLGINLEKILNVWKFGSSPGVKVVENVLSRASTRLFYAKYLAFERWHNETWTSQEIVEECWEDEEYYTQLSGRKTRKKKKTDSSDNDIKNVFLSMTERSKEIQKYDLDNRILMVGSSVINNYSTKDKLNLIVNRMAEINKLRKDLPYLILGVWNSNSNLKHVSLLRRSKAFGICKGMMNQRLRYGFESLFGFSKIVSSSIMKKKVKNMIKTFTKALEIQAHPVYLPLKFKFKQKILLRSIINGYENARYVLGMSFTRWILSNNSLVKDRKTIKRLNLNILAKYMKNPIFFSFQAWKNYKTPAFTPIKPAFYVFRHLIKTRKIFGVQKWKKFVWNCKEKLISDNLKSKTLLNQIRLVPQRCIQEAFKRITEKPNKANPILVVIKSKFINTLKLGLRIWRDNVNKYDKIMYLNRLRLLKLHKFLWSLANRQFKLCAKIITDAGNKLNLVLDYVYNTAKRKPKHAFDLWRLKANKIDKKLMKAEIIGQKVLLSMKKATQRATKKYYSILLGQNYKLKSSIKKIIDCIKGKLKFGLQKWKQIHNEGVQKYLFDKFRALKLTNSFKNIIKNYNTEIVKRVTSQNVGEATRRTMESLINGLKGIPKKALKMWNKKVVEIKKQELVNDFKGSKLLNIMQKIPRRTLKEIQKRTNGIMLVYAKLRLSLQTIDRIRRRKPKQTFDLWRKYALDKKNHSIIQTYNLQFIKISFEKILKRTIRDALERIKNKEKDIKSAVKIIQTHVLRGSKAPFVLWKNYTKLAHSHNIISDLKLQIGNSTLQKIYKKRLRNCLYRIVSSGGKIKDAMQGMVNGLKNIPKKALKRWNKTVLEIAAHEMKMNLKGAQIFPIMKRVLQRTVKDVGSRIKGDIFLPLSIQGFAINLCNIRKRRPKQAFDRWKKFVNAKKNSILSEELRIVKLKYALLKISTRILRDFLQRVLGGGNKIKGAFMIYTSVILRRPKSAFDLWKKYIILMNQKKILDSLKFLKSENLIKKIILRTCKGTVERILGGGDRVKGAIQMIVQSMKYIPMITISKWSKITKEIKEKKLMDTFRSEKLKGKFSNLLRRTLRNTMSRFASSEISMTYAKSLMKRLDTILKKKHNIIFSRWKNITKLNAEYKLKSVIRGQRLHKSLSRLINKTYFKIGKGIMERNNHLQRAMSMCIKVYKKKPKEAFSVLRHHSLLVSKRFAFEDINSLKLKNSIDSISKLDETNPLQKAKQLERALKKLVKRRLKKNYNATRKVNNLITKLKRIGRNLMFSIRNTLKRRFEIWKYYLIFNKNKKLIDSIKIGRFRQCLENTLRRTLKEFVKRTFTQEERVKEALNTVANSLKIKPKLVIKKWKLAVQYIREKLLMEGIMFEKLRNYIERLSIRRIRDSFKQIINSLTNHQLIQSIFKWMNTLMKKKPKEAFDRWKALTESFKVKSILNHLRNHKLRLILEKIPRKKYKESFRRILGEGSIVKGALKTIYTNIQRMPKECFDSWVRYTNNFSKKMMIDKLRIQKLTNNLDRLIARSLRTAFLKIVIGKRKLRDSIQSLISSLKFKQTQAFECLKKNLAHQKYLEVVQSSTSLKFSNRISSVVIPKLKNYFDRFRNILFGKYIKKADLIVNKIQNFSSNIKSHYFNYWNNIVIENKLRTTIIMLKTKLLKNSLVSSLKSKKNQAFDSIKQKRLFFELSKLTQNVAGLKLAAKLISLKNKSTRGCFDQFKRLLFDSESLKLNNMLRAIDKFHSTIQSQHYNKWKVKLLEIKHKKIANSLKGKFVSKSLNDVLYLKKKSTVFEIIQKIKSFHKITKFFKSIAKTKLERSLFEWKLKINTVDTNSSRMLRGLSKLKRLSKKVCKTVLNKILKRLEIKQMVTKLTKNLSNLQRSALESFKEAVRKGKIIKKVSASHVISRIMKSKAMIMLSGRFSYWKNLEDLRKHRIRRNVIMKWISMTSINYENSFWKLKFVWNKRFMYFDPKHAIAFRKFTKIFNSYQTRLKQFAHFKLVMFFKVFSVQDSACNSPMSRRSSFASRHYGVPDNTQSLRSYTPLGNREENEDIKIYAAQNFRSSTPVGRQTENEDMKLYDVQNTRKHIKPSIPSGKKNQGKQNKLHGPADPSQVIKLNAEEIPEISQVPKPLNLLDINNEGIDDYNELNLSNECKSPAITEAKIHDINAHEVIYNQKFRSSTPTINENINLYGAPRNSQGFRSSTPTGIKHESNSEYRISTYGQDFRSSTPTGQSNMNIIRSISPINIRFYTANMYYGGYRKTVALRSFTSNPSTMTSNDSLKLTKPEVIGIRQLGGIEILSVQLRNVRTRKMAIGMTSLIMCYKNCLVFEHKKSRYIEQCDKLKHEKQNLIEDNIILRKHNEVLIENLEATNNNFEVLNLSYEQLKLQRMVMILNRTIDLPLLELFFIFRGSRNRYF